MRAKTLNKEVLVAEDAIVRLGRGDVGSLKAAALRNERLRVRLCAHKDVSEALHEMFIIHARDAYVRPHKHLSKAESLHVLEGEADVAVYDEAGNMTEVFRLGEYGSGLPFYYRIPPGQYHSLLIRSDVFAFHECTTGPFDRSGSVMAPWSPEDTDAAAVAAFLRAQRSAAAAKLEE